MAQSYVSSDLFVQGSLSAKQTVLSAGCVNDAAVVAGAGIEATKVVHQFAKSVDQKPGTAVVAATDLVHQVFPAGTTVSVIAGLLVSVVTPPTGTDTVTIDLKRSTGGGAFASVLSAALVLSSSTPALTPQSASVASPDLNGSDLLEIVVTVSGASAEGLIVEVFLRENPQ